MVIVSPMDEADYRQSRLCRLLGNPVAFTVVRLLAKGKEMNTSEIESRWAERLACQQYFGRLETRRRGPLSNGRNPSAIPAQTSTRDRENS
jgi:hypothetical protein